MSILIAQVMVGSGVQLAAPAYVSMLTSEPGYRVWTCADIAVMRLIKPWGMSG